MTHDLRIRLIPGDSLDTWIRAFLDDLALANRSPGTTRFYRGNLQRFHWWCNEFGIPSDPEQISTADIRQFLIYVQNSNGRWGQPGNHMASKPSTPALLHVYYRSLRPFFNWLVDQEVIDRSPMDKVRAPRVRSDQPEPFDQRELRRLAKALNDAGDGELAMRDRAIVAVLLDVGLRASELGALQATDLNIATGDLLVRAGKGDKSRQLRIGARARRSVRRYWIHHRARHGEVGPLFLTMTGRALTQDSLKQMLARVGQRAGVHPVNPHRFRHTAAIMAIRAGMNLFHVQMMLGHTSLEMTKRYVKLAESDLSDAARDHSALDFMKLGI